MRKPLIAVLMVLFTGKLLAQVLPADTVPAIIKYSPEKEGLKFSALLRPLRPIAGAPEPFYTYFWEFGDGSFSFEKDPLHIYPDSGIFKARLYATNNYDDGKRPPTRPAIIKSTTKPKPVLASVTNRSLFKETNSLSLKTSCMPKPGDDMQLVFGYRNKQENNITSLNGTLAIFYNDKNFTKDNFVLGDTRRYHHEAAADLRPYLQASVMREYTLHPYYASADEQLPVEITAEFRSELGTEIKEKAAAFRDHAGWKFENLKAGEEKFLFMELKTTPEMLKDTNAVVNISAVFIPDNPLLKPEFLNLELQIVASHDPNKMQLQNSRMNYRFTGKNRELTYKVKFQNTGKGPAKKVDVGVLISPVFDRNTIRISDSKPKLQLYKPEYPGQSYLDTLSNNQDSIHFVFRNIYLPGTTQEGVNDADSTMGYVEYKIRFTERPKKLPIKSGAAIVFDKNEPIYTNNATGRFKKGISPALITGYGFPFTTNNQGFLSSRNVAVGAAVSTFAPHRKYLQAELYVNSFESSTVNFPATSLIKDTTINARNYVIVSRARSSTSAVTTINLVPFQLRYNFNKYFGAGAGTLVSLNLSEKRTEKLKYVLQGANGVASIDLEKIAAELKDRFSNPDISFFADIQLGRVYAGPSVGLRYLYNPKQDNNRMISYITWKF